MSIKLGTQNIVGLYKGNTEIVKRYKGSNLIYESLLPYSFEYLYNSLVPQYMNKSKIPEEYQEVKYIESTGTQYIDTGLVPSVNHSFSIKFSVGYLGNCVAFGSRTSGNYASSLDQIYLNVTNNDEIKLFNIFGTNDLVLNNKVEANTVFTYKNIQNDNCQLSSPTQPYYIFTLNNMGSPSTIANIKMYYFKIYDNNILVRDFVPCYRKSDNVIGLYDKVNSVFYTNAGTGTFLKGNDVKLTVKDKAQVNTIYGNSVVENQQFKINSTDQTRTLNGITMTDNRDGSYTFNGTATSETILAVGGSIPTINIGDKYLVFGGAKGGSSTTYFLTQNSSGGANDYGNGAVYTQPDNQYGRFLCVVVRNGVTVNNLVVKPQHISLTQWYPFNTPTALTDTRVQSIINRGNIPYNTGTLKSVNIGEFVSEPYNLFDGELESGSIQQSSGQNTENAYAFRTKNYTRVVAGQTYTFENSLTQLATLYIRYYDISYNYIGYETGTNANTQNIIIPNNVVYIRAYWYRANTDWGTNPPSQNEAQVCLHRTGTRTGYAPHTQSHTLPFIYQGNSALNAHDTLEITDTQYVFTKNISRDDLGTLNWTPYTGLGDTKLYWATISDIKLSSNLLCSSLTQVPAVYNTGNDNSISSHPSWSRVYARTTNAQATASEFKTAMSGIMLYYELATPQVTRIPKKHLAVVDLGTLDWSYNSETKRFSTNGIKSSIKHEYGSNNINIYCKNYSASSTGDRVIWGGWNGEINVLDSSYTDATTFKSAMAGTYLFYETQDEVADIISDINIEAGGTLTSNWFSWVENQLSNPTPISQTINGLVFTNNGDGSYTVDGTATADTTKSVGGTFSIISGHYYLIYGGASGGSNSTYRLLEGYTYRWNDTDGNGHIQNATAGGNASLIIDIKSGTTCNNLVFKPQFIDLTLGFGEGKEPTSINDPRIQYIIKQGYIPTNTTGTNKSVTSEVLPNIDVSFNRK